MKLKLKDKIKYGSAPGRILMTLLVMTSILIILQVIIIESFREFYPRSSGRTLPETKRTAEEEKQHRIDDARKKFLPDGTLHLIQTEISGSRLSGKENVYDTQNNLLWSGKAKGAPYAYLQWSDDYSYYH
jgi:hypothetical protein